MSFFSDLPGKQDKTAELMNSYINKLIRSLQQCVRDIDAKGGKSANLLVVYNSYDHDLYCISKSKHEKMQLFIGKHIPDSQQIPSILGGFGMEEFPFPASQVVMEVKKELSSLGSKSNNVGVVTIPTYGHPYRGLFDKRLDYNRLKVTGSCETIEIDLFW